MTEMAQRLGLEHADSGVRVDLGRLTVVADTDAGPVYMDTGIGSAKNWVGYHLSTVLSLQQHFIRRSRPVPSFLVLDQPTQAFFPADTTDAEIPDEDRVDALAQFEPTSSRSLEMPCRSWYLITRTSMSSGSRTPFANGGVMARR